MSQVVDTTSSQTIDDIVMSQDVELVPLETVKKDKSFDASKLYIMDAGYPDEMAIRFSGASQEKARQLFEKAARMMNMDLDKLADKIAVFDDSIGVPANVTRSGMAFSEPGWQGLDDKSLDVAMLNESILEFEDIALGVAIHELVHLEQIQRKQEGKSWVIASDDVQLRASADNRNVKQTTAYFEIEAYVQSQYIANKHSDVNLGKNFELSNVAKIKHYLANIPPEHQVDTLNGMVAPWLGEDFVATHFSEYYVAQDAYPNAAPVANYIIDNVPYLKELPVVGNMLETLSKQNQPAPQMSTDERFDR